MPHFLGSMGVLCAPSHSGHSGSGKTEAAKKMVQFLSHLEQEQTGDRRCQVRGSWPFPRAVFRPLAPPWGQPQALPPVGQARVGWG